MFFSLFFSSMLYDIGRIAGADNEGGGGVVIGNQLHKSLIGPKLRGGGGGVTVFI